MSFFVVIYIFIYILTILLLSLHSFTVMDLMPRESSDPFEKPDCEAVEIFVNEILCLGKGLNAYFLYLY